jgi:hypothetical protein
MESWLGDVEEAAELSEPIVPGQPAETAPAEVISGEELRLREEAGEASALAQE